MKCLINNMVSLHHHQTLELELGDVAWRDFAVSFYVLLIRFLSSCHFLLIAVDFNIDKKLHNYLKITGILTLIPLTWRIWWARNNASKWQMGFNSAFKGLNNVFRPQKSLKKTRIRFYNSLALPLLLYEYETWTIKTRDARRITAAEMKYMRRTAGYTGADYKTNTQITKEWKITPLLDKLLE